MLSAIDPAAIGATLEETWSPRVVAELDDSYVKVARIQGGFGWHSHPAEDELFLVLRGCMRLEMAHGTVELKQGELFVVPKGARHAPSADADCLILLVEKKTTLHGGDTDNPRARSIASQLQAPG
ncbi:MAG: cupin domain-containing protein [Pseudomonadota bacterium]